LTAECSHFIDCVLGRASPVNDAHGGLRVLKALEAADRSLKDNSRAVSV